MTPSEIVAKLDELRNEAMLAVEYLAALREAAAIIERLRDDRSALDAVVKAAMDFAWANKTTGVSTAWWKRRDETEAVLFARCARLAKLEGGK